MNRRPGITLLEVLVAIFVMGIGLLALLTLFPLAALTMAQAIRDDRAAQCAQQANNWSQALELWQDPIIFPIGMSPTLPCYIDGFGTQMYFATLGPNFGSPNIPRINPASLTGLPGGGTTPTGATIPPTPWIGTTTPIVDTYNHFALLDDLTFDQNGAAATSGSAYIERGAQYTWGYFLSKAGTLAAPKADLKIVVYYGRTAQSGEVALPPSAVAGAGSSSLTVTYAGTPPSIRRGSWIFDGGPPGPGNAVGYFYRVLDATDLGGTLQLQLETPLFSPIGTTNSVLYLEDVIEVFEEGLQ
jgi:type II secretory pathway pseudopilin PulG